MYGQKSMYRHIFETQFNLFFGNPRSDTCSVCDAGENTTDHTENYQFALERKQVDRRRPMIDKTVCYITMDLQLTMSLPKLTTSKAFYLRQMWFYNFGIYCVIHLEHKSIGLRM
ncbi:hypothetical protein JTB14_010859 [Gonioctena quinquepunctata]|nr:hypothetical protein JTB14_010859 [Gonioctena quinquepunctata]